MNRAGFSQIKRVPNFYVSRYFFLILSGQLTLQFLWCAKCIFHFWFSKKFFSFLRKIFLVNFAWSICAKWFWGGDRTVKYDFVGVLFGWFLEQKIVPFCDTFLHWCLGKIRKNCKLFGAQKIVEQKYCFFTVSRGFFFSRSEASANQMFVYSSEQHKYSFFKK